VRQVGYLQGSYGDARSTEYKIGVGNVDEGGAVGVSGHGGGAWDYSDGILVLHIQTYIFHHNMELIHNSGTISALKCMFLLMECIVHFINYFFYMPNNICLGIFDHVPNLLSLVRL